MIRGGDVGGCQTFPHVVFIVLSFFSVETRATRPPGSPSESKACRSGGGPLPHTASTFSAISRSLSLLCLWRAVTSHLLSLNGCSEVLVEEMNRWPRVQIQKYMYPCQSKQEVKQEGK